MGETPIGLRRIGGGYRCRLILVRATRVFHLGLYLRYTAAHGFSHISTQKGRRYEIRIDANPYRDYYGDVYRVSSGSCLRERPVGPGGEIADGRRGLHECSGAQRYSGG